MQNQLAVHQWTEAMMRCGYPYLWKPPSDKYRAAIQAAQVEAEPLVRDETMESKGKQRGKYSSAEEWLKQARSLLHKHGLYATQSSSIRLLHGSDRFVFPVLRVETTVLLQEDGTGWVYTLEIPMWGDRGTIIHTTWGGLTSAFKYGFRGVFLTPQIDPGEELEQESIAAAEERKKRQEENRAAAEKARQRKADRKASVQQQTEDELQQRQEDESLAKQGAKPINDAAGEEKGVDFAELALVEKIRKRAASGDPSFQRTVEGLIPASRRTGKLDKLLAYVEENLPQHAPKEPPPIDQEDVVKAAQQVLESEKVETPPPADTEPAAEPAADGGNDPTRDELEALGWAATKRRAEFLTMVMELPANEAIPAAARPTILGELGSFWDGDHTAAMKAWEGTGFKPLGKGGPLPTGVHVRRYMKKIDWTQTETTDKE